MKHAKLHSANLPASNHVPATEHAHKRSVQPTPLSRLLELLDKDEVQPYSRRRFSH